MASTVFATGSKRQTGSVSANPESAHDAAIGQDFDGSDGLSSTAPMAPRIIAMQSEGAPAVCADAENPAIANDRINSSLANPAMILFAPI